MANKFLIRSEYNISSVVNNSTNKSFLIPAAHRYYAFNFLFSSDRRVNIRTHLRTSIQCLVKICLPNILIFEHFT